MQKECNRHGLTEFCLEKRKYWRCKKCRVAHVTNWRKKKKQELVLYKGGKCAACGYNKCMSALEFHHLDSSEKEFGLAHNGFTRSIEVQKREADKCVLLCANCHREAEAGLISIPR